MIQIETCVDCNSYDDVTYDDTFMNKVGDVWLCAMCGESREYLADIEARRNAPGVTGVEARRHLKYVKVHLPEALEGVIEEFTGYHSRGYHNRTEEQQADVQREVLQALATVVDRVASEGV